MKKVLPVILLAVLSSCASTLITYKYEPSGHVTQKAYAQANGSLGTVLLSAKWSRTWNCGGHENAELRSIGFDLFDESNTGGDSAPDLVVNGSAWESPAYKSFAFLVKPGTYALSYVEIKIADSVSSVYYIAAERSKLTEGGEAKGGTFNVGPGEAVYIGHFGLDCTYEPTLWRYYLEDQEGFEEYVQGFREHYKYLDLKSVSYRLFQTREFGHDFTL
jgi:hypothetical protein